MKKIALGGDLAKEKDVIQTKQFGRAILWICVAIAPAATLSADSITFSLLPGDGNLSATPGSLVGWGYSITNNSAADWFLATGLNSDSFSNGIPTSLFDFPEVGPSQTVTEAFDAVNSIGLFELRWDTSAPSGFVNAGSFVLSGQWWNGDPFNGGSLIATATDVAQSYSATVSGASGPNTPEPAAGYLLLFAIGICAILRHRSLSYALTRSGRER